jgi:hypothetical protein
MRFSLSGTNFQDSSARMQKLHEFQSGPKVQNNGSATSYISDLTDAAHSFQQRKESSLFSKMSWLYLGTTQPFRWPEGALT